jgi:hypothetical protein
MILLVCLCQDRPVPVGEMKCWRLQFAWHGRRGVVRRPPSSCRHEGRAGGDNQSWLFMVKESWTSRWRKRLPNSGLRVRKLNTTRLAPKFRPGRPNSGKFSLTALPSSFLLPTVHPHYPRAQFNLPLQHSHHVTKHPKAYRAICASVHPWSLHTGRSYSVRSLHSQT